MKGAALDPTYARGSGGSAVAWSHQGTDPDANGLPIESPRVTLEGGPGAL